jgi:peptidoglycan/xylan/chitin deacetylase (PgdA/CDA1 family)
VSGEAGPWPGGAPAALSLSFDNLGEAAEIELGALPAGAPLGGHPSATRAVPAILEALASHGLAATFFVEGLNAEAYPELLGVIDAAGHEVAYHAWRHEQWGKLPAKAQEENLARGISALAGLGLEVAGFRPPGGDLGPGGTRVLREAGLRYCSPAGSGVGAEGEGLALLPFEWRHVDASCVLPDLGPPREPGQFVADLEADLERLGGDGGHLALVLHPFMLDWLGEDRLAALFARLAEAARLGELWTAPCRAVAERVLADPEAFAGGVPLSGP